MGQCGRREILETGYKATGSPDIHADAHTEGKVATAGRLPYLPLCSPVKDQAGTIGLQILLQRDMARICELGHTGENVWICDRNRVWRRACLTPALPSASPELFHRISCR